MAKPWNRLLAGLKQLVLQGPTLDSSTASVLDLLAQAPAGTEGGSKAVSELPAILGFGDIALEM
eukprot:6574455-Lingulodinium_polyedra.AAC.1